MRQYFIYKITNIKNNKIYIGMTTNFNNRIKCHLKSLKNKNHKNKYLQEDFNNFNENDFNFEIIIDIVGERKDASNLEEKITLEYIDNKYELYNINIGNRLGEEVKKHFSDIYKGKGNPFYGKKHSEETINSIKEKCKAASLGSNNAKYKYFSSEQKKNFIEMYNNNEYTLDDISNHFNCDRKLITRRAKEYNIYIQKRNNNYINFSDIKINEIIEMYKNGQGYCSIAKKLNVNKGTIYKILIEHNILCK